MEVISKRTHIKDGNIFYKNFCVDPLFYSLRKVRWDIMLTFHYKTADYYRDNEFSEKNRRMLIKKGIVIKTLKTLRQPINDIQFAGFTEKKNGRCHSHTLLHIKDKSPLKTDIIADTIKLMIPHEIIMSDSKDEEKQIEFIKDSEAAAAYICKFNSNDLDLHNLFKSKYLLEYVKYI